MFFSRQCIKKKVGCRAATFSDNNPLTKFGQNVTHQNFNLPSITLPFDQNTLCAQRKMTSPPETKKAGFYVKGVRLCNFTIMKLPLGAKEGSTKTDLGLQKWWWKVREMGTLVSGKSRLVCPVVCFTFASDHRPAIASRDRVIDMTRQRGRWNNLSESEGVYVVAGTRECTLSSHDDASVWQVFSGFFFERKSFDTRLEWCFFLEILQFILLRSCCFFRWGLVM